MKKTSKEFMEWLGLKVGDRIKTKDNFIFEVVKNNFYFLKGVNIPENRNLDFLIDLEIDILPRPKRVGDLKCGIIGKDGQATCSNCPIKSICQLTRLENVSLYEIFEDVFKYEDYFDQEIYDLLKARLDKEVE